MTPDPGDLTLEEYCNRHGLSYEEMNCHFNREPVYDKPNPNQPDKTNVKDRKINPPTT